MDPEAEEDLQQQQKVLLLGLLALCVALKGGTITAAGFATQAAVMLSESHATAMAIAAGLDEPTPEMRQRADQIANAEVAFLAGLAAAILAGDYASKEEGGRGAKALRARLALYSLKITGTANAELARRVEEEARANGQPEPECLWVLGVTDRHCSDCIAESETGWRRLSQLTRHPGDGSTACLANCQCHLEFRDGSRSFSNR